MPALGDSVNLNAAATCITQCCFRRDLGNQIQPRGEMGAVPVGVSGVACQHQSMAQKPNPASQLESVNATMFPGIF